MRLKVENKTRAPLTNRHINSSRRIILILQSTALRLTLCIVPSRHPFAYRSLFHEQNKVPLAIDVKKKNDKKKKTTTKKKKTRTERRTAKMK